MYIVSFSTLVITCYLCEVSMAFKNKKNKLLVLMVSTLLLFVVQYLFILFNILSYIFISANFFFIYCIF